MDRTLKVYTKTDHLFAQFTFNYDDRQRATAQYIQYRRLYSDDEEDESKSVFEIDNRELNLQFRQFNSIDQVKAHDIELVKNELGRDMKDPATTYKYVYEAPPILQRYTVVNRNGCVGIINIMYSFINNTKEVQFLSGTNPRYDFELSSNSLETNSSCIQKIPVYTDRDSGQISFHDLKQLPQWY
jgi:hypothetical protein